MAPSSLAALSLHVEQLYDDEVWRRLLGLATAMERKGGRLTLFVSTGRAGDRADTVCRRAVELAERGHEVGQHTHYVAAGPGAGTVPPSPADVLRCLELDHGRLTGAGLRPQGFVAGTWAVHDDVFDWLGEHGFAYDSTFRTFRLPYENPGSEAGDDHASVAWHRGLVALPTTGWLRRGLGRELRGRPRSLHMGDVGYDLYYLHDYDLLNRRARLACRVLVALLARRAQLVVAGTLAQAARARLPLP